MVRSWDLIWKLPITITIFKNWNPIPCIWWLSFKNTAGAVISIIQTEHWKLQSQFIIFINLILFIHQLQLRLTFHIQHLGLLLNFFPSIRNSSPILFKKQCMQFQECCQLYIGTIEAIVGMQFKKFINLKSHSSHAIAIVFV